MTSLTLLAASAVLFLLPRVGPTLWKYATSKETSYEDLMVKEYRALLTLRTRATRRKCEKLAAAVEQVEECFMGGDDPQ